MKTVNDLISAFGGPTKFAEAMGFKHPSTASEMQRRESIPVKYFPKIVEEARSRGIKGVTVQRLVEIHASNAAA